MSQCLNKQIQFYVAGDSHIEEETGRQTCLASQAMLRDMKERKDYRDHSFLFVVGDLTSSTKYQQKENYVNLYTLNKKSKPDQECILCDGLGNHDVYSRGLNFGHKQMYGLIKSRNKDREKIFDGDFDYGGDSDKLHYHIKRSVCGEKVHFIHLNLIPTDRYVLKTSGGQNIDGKDALTYLRYCLATISSTEPVFLFHHIGFVRFDEEESKWWTKEDREAYLTALDSHTVAGIFFGHVHEIKKVESFDTDIQEELEAHGLQGNCFLSGAIQSQGYYDITFSKENKEWKGEAVICGKNGAAGEMTVFTPRPSKGVGNE